MEVSGSYAVGVPARRMWEFLMDPANVAACLPGCEALDPIGEGEYRVVLTVGLAAITGRYEGTVRMIDQEPPRSYRLVVEGRGAAGFVRGESRISLVERDAGTVIEVRGEVQVGGAIARVGQRLLSGVSRMMMDRFFDCVRHRAEA